MYTLVEQCFWSAVPIINFQGQSILKGNHTVLQKVSLVLLIEQIPVVTSSFYLLTSYRWNLISPFVNLP